MGKIDFRNFSIGKELDIAALFGGGSAMPPAQQQPPVAPAPSPTPPTIEDAAQENPTAVAFERQEEQQAQAAAKSSFEKAAVFSYGSAKENIENPSIMWLCKTSARFTNIIIKSMTFEELRIAKSDDFPELEVNL